jgi:AcrR family transcriptional regulator
VARTLNREAHTIRREAFIDVAARLVQAKGYEVMSIQEVLDELGASRGALYHYFDGKAALLNAVIERMVDDATAALKPVLDDPALPAPEKLNRFFNGIAAWKMERKELLLAVLQVWLADENAIVREKFRKALVHRLAPLFEKVIDQGRGEGTFSVASSGPTARVVVSMIIAANDAASELYVARQAGTISIDDVECSFVAYADAFERILGAPSGTYPRIDRAVLREWFG